MVDKMPLVYDHRKRRVIKKRGPRRKKQDEKGEQLKLD
jgi:hypothetical protein